MGLGTDRSKAIKKIKTLVYTPKSDTAKFRKNIEDVFSVVVVPNSVECVDEEICGVPCDILDPVVCSQKRVLLYIHGGSFVGGSRKSWRGFCASLANSSSTRTIVPEFPLAPEHPFPEALDLLTPLLIELIGEYEDVVLGSDGSGACLAMALVQKLLEQKIRLPSKIVLFSPIFDISNDSVIFRVKKAADEIINADSIRRCADVYTYYSNLKNPLVSPMYIPDDLLAQFPEVFIQCGKNEMLFPTIEKFCEKMHLAHLRYFLDGWDDMVHLFQMADEYLSQSHIAVDKVGQYIKGEL